MKHNKSLESQLYDIGLISLIICPILGGLYLHFLVPRLAVPCLFYTFLGMYCPGCGGTRAITALLHGQLLQSVWYHPVVPYTAVMFLGFMITHTLEKLHVARIHGWKFHDWYIYVALVIIVVNFILKNVLLLKYHITL